MDMVGERMWSLVVAGPTPLCTIPHGGEASGRASRPAVMRGSCDFFSLPGDRPRCTGVCWRSIRVAMAAETIA